MKKLLSSLSIVCIMLVGCSATKPVTAEKPAVTEGITWEVLLQSSIGGSDTPQVMVAKEPSIVNEFFAGVNKRTQSHFAVPKVDYTKEMLVILCMGQKNTGGYQLNIKGIEENPFNLVITVSETSPQPGEMVVTMLTQPFLVAKLKASDKKVIFKKE